MNTLETTAARERTAYAFSKYERLMESQTNRRLPQTGRLSIPVPCALRRVELIVDCLRQSVETPAHIAGLYKINKFFLFLSRLLCVFSMVASKMFFVNQFFIMGNFPADGGLDRASSARRKKF